MKRPCDSCSAPYEALRPWSRFCSPTCRRRASRGALAPHALPPPPPGGGRLVRAVLAELEEADRVESPMGQAALLLARRIDENRDTGSAMASLHHELRVTLEAAVAGARVPTSPLRLLRDDLAERRRARGVSR